MGSYEEDRALHEHARMWKWPFQMRAWQFSYTTQTQSTLTQRMSVQQHFPSLPAEVQKNRVRSAWLTTAISSRDLPCFPGLQTSNVAPGKRCLQGRLEHKDTSLISETFGNKRHPFVKNLCNTVHTLHIWTFGCSTPNFGCHVHPVWVVYSTEGHQHHAFGNCLPPADHLVDMFLQIQPPTLLECSLVYSHRQAAARETNQGPSRIVTTSTNMALQEPQQDGAPRSMVKQRVRKRVLRHIQKREKRALQIMQKSGAIEGRLPWTSRCMKFVHFPEKEKYCL